MARIISFWQHALCQQSSAVHLCSSLIQCFLTLFFEFLLCIKAVLMYMLPNALMFCFLEELREHNGKLNVCLYVCELYSWLFPASCKSYHLDFIFFSFSLLTFPWSWLRQFEEHTMVNLCLTSSVTSPCNCRRFHCIFAKVPSASTAVFNNASQPQEMSIFVQFQSLYV